MIISRTPFRISFLGGGTDYPQWYRRHGGTVLSTAIDKYCYLTCRYLPPFFEHKYRILWSKTEKCRALNEITHPVIPKAVSFMGIEKGLEIHHDGDLPARSGMGSSSTFVVGLLHTLFALKGLVVSRNELLEKSLHVEQNILDETVGSQDQTIAVYGGFNVIRFKRNDVIEVHPLTLSGSRLNAFNDHLMLFYSGISRRSSSIAECYVSNMRKKEKILHEMHDMVDEGVALLSSATDLRSFGELLHRAWCRKQELGKNINNSCCDDIYRRALQAGALGGKMLGAGGGGFMLFFVTPDHKASVRRALEKFVCVPIKINAPGSQIIHYEAPVEYDYSINGK